jgi:rhodanese-related sulfurtransferase
MSDLLKKVALGGLVLLTAGWFLFPRGGDVNGEGARKLVEDGARIVDVRTPEEFGGGHIPGALNIPVQQLPQRMSELEPKDKAIVVYCHSGNRSGQAAGLLKGAGFSQVHDLGPMSRW